MRRSRRVAAQRCAEPQPTAVVAGKEERAIPAIVNPRDADRAAHSSSEFVPHEGSLRNAPEILKEIRGVECGITMHFVHGAVKSVCSAANGDVHDAAGVLTAVRARVGRDADFFDGI